MCVYVPSVSLVCVCVCVCVLANCLCCECVCVCMCMFVCKCVSLLTKVDEWMLLLYPAVFVCICVPLFMKMIRIRWDYTSDLWLAYDCASVCVCPNTKVSESKESEETLGHNYTDRHNAGWTSSWETRPQMAPIKHSPASFKWLEMKWRTRILLLALWSEEAHPLVL